MNNEYIIVNKTTILETIEELKASLNFIPESYISKHLAQIYAFEQVLLRSIPLIPEIDKAFDASKITTGMNQRNQFAYKYKNSKDYVTNLKLDI